MADFQSEMVSVDRSFARFGSKSFAINKITSVDVRSTVKPGSKMHWVLGLGAILAIWKAFDSTLYDSIGYFIGALVCGLLSWFAFTQSTDVTSYQLYLHTSGSEVQAYQTTDEDEIARLRTSLEDAIADASDF